MKTVFLTITGGSEEDYEMLLGCMGKHLVHGQVVVVDTSLQGPRNRLQIPFDVHWYHLPVFGRGPERFRFATALNVAIGLAEELEPDVLVQVDSDEYYEDDLVHALRRAHEDRWVVDVKTLHHVEEGWALDFPEEWHRRIWPAGLGIRYRLNPRHDNPEWHPIVDVPLGISIERETKTFLHHIHYAVGEKRHNLHTAISTIPGWPDRGLRVPVPPWPDPIREWQKGSGQKPSEPFEEARQCR